MSFPLAAMGEFAQAMEHLKSGLMHGSEWVGEHDMYALLADLATRQADLEALNKYVPLAEASAGKIGHVLYGAIAHRAFGVIHRLEGNFAQAEERFEKALAVFRDLEVHWQTGRTYFELGKLASARNEVATASDYYQRSLGLFGEMKAREYISLANDVLRSCRN